MVSEQHQKLLTEIIVTTICFPMKKNNKFNVKLEEIK